MVESRRQFVALSVLAAAALTLRLACCAYLGFGDTPEPASDDSDYFRYAWNLAHGNGYRGPEPGSDGDVVSAYIPPGVPALYAPLIALLGDNYAALRVVNCLLSSASVLALWFLSRGVANERVAWVAAVLFAIWPSALFYCHGLLTENLYVLMVLLLATACVRWLAPRPSIKAASVTGVLLGLTALVRPTILMFVPALGLWCLIALPSVRQAVAYGILVLVCAGAVIAPWTWRNYRVYDQFVLISPVAWTVFIQGNNSVVMTDPKLSGYCVWYSEIPEYRGKFDGLNQLEREPVAKELALTWLNENRDLWPRLVWNKFVRFWNPLLKQDSGIVRFAMLASWGPVLVLFVPAFFVTLARYLRRRDPAIWMHLFVLTVLGQCLMYFGLPRYRYPIEPFCLIFAAMSLVVLESAVFGVRARGRNEGLRASVTE